VREIKIDQERWEACGLSAYDLRTPPGSAMASSKQTQDPSDQWSCPNKPRGLLIQSNHQPPQWAAFRRPNGRKELFEMNILEPRFELGRTYATAAVTRWAEQHGIDLSKLMYRHHRGDWGDLCQEDKQANEDALDHGSRIFSSYLTGSRKIYCITEADRSMTTLLFASEY